MSGYHGIIDRGRTYAGGGASTTGAQDRRIVQEVIRHLASLVEGVNAEQLLDAITIGLDERGFYAEDMDNLLKFFDAVRAKLESPTAARRFQAGDKVRCPSGTAQGDYYDTIIGVGTVTDYEDDQNIRVDWPEGKDWWWHTTSELELVVEQPVTPADVHFGLVPSIVNQLRLLPSSVTATYSQERELVAALLGHVHVRNAILNFNREELQPAREAIADVLDGDGLYRSEVDLLLNVYRDNVDPETAQRRAERRRKEARLEELRAEAAALEAELG